MASINARTGKLYFDFRYKGQRCREYTKLEDNQPNRRRMEKILQRIEAEITLGTFVYRDYFPDSSKANIFDTLAKRVTAAQLSPYQGASDMPTFKEFTEVWLSDMSVEWRESHKKTVMLNLNTYVLPAFGGKRISDITKADILNFRSNLAKDPDSEVLKRLLCFMDRAFAADDEKLKELISVSFLENLSRDGDSFEGIRVLLSAKLSEELSKYA